MIFEGVDTLSGSLKREFTVALSRSLIAEHSACDDNYSGHKLTF